MIPHFLDIVLGVVKVVRRGEGFTVAWRFPHLVGDEMLLVLKSAGVALMSGGTLAVSYYGQDATGVNAPGPAGTEEQTGAAACAAHCRGPSAAPAVNDAGAVMQ